VRDRIANSCVGLAACCDPPDVEDKLLFFFSEKFEGATSLPFGVFMTPDFEFVHGFTGSRSVKQFQADLDLVEKHPLFPATAEAAAKLTKLGERAAKDAAAEKWAKVLKTGRAGAAIRGACPERKALDDAVAAARKYAESRFMWVETEAKTADDVVAMTKELRAVQKLFKGEPEAAAAKLGQKAVITALAIRVAAEDTGADTADARKIAAEQYAGTRWEWLFRKRPPPDPDDDDIDWENIPDDELVDDPETDSDDE